CYRRTRVDSPSSGTGVVHALERIRRVAGSGKRRSAGVVLAGLLVGALLGCSGGADQNTGAGVAPFVEASATSPSAVVSGQAAPSAAGTPSPSTTTSVAPKQTRKANTRAAK